MSRLLAFAVLALTVGCAGLTLAYSQWTMSHITTGHVTINTPTPPEPTGNFTIPIDVTFPSIEPGEQSQVTIQVTSALSQTVTLTAQGGAGDVTVTSTPVALQPGATINIQLTLTADLNTEPDSYTFPIRFTVTT